MQDRGDFQEFRYLAAEAEKALHGDPIGVQCSPAPPYPETPSKPYDPDKAKATESRILDAGRKIADATQALPDAASNGQTQLRLASRIAAIQARKFPPDATQTQINREMADKEAQIKVLLAADAKARQLKEAADALARGEVVDVAFDTSVVGQGAGAPRKVPPVPVPSRSVLGNAKAEK
jgi:hypothetical protein